MLHDNHKIHTVFLVAGKSEDMYERAALKIFELMTEWGVLSLTPFQSFNNSSTNGSK